MRLEQIFAGLELSIAKSAADKAPIEDVEALERTKADSSEIKRVEEKVNRLERLVEERLAGLDDDDDEDEIEVVEPDG
jgi:hypothetical protein